MEASHYSKESAGDEQRKEKSKVSHKLYEYEGEKFQVFEPKDRRIAVKGKGLTAYITVHEGTSRFLQNVEVTASAAHAFGAGGGAE